MRKVYFLIFAGIMIVVVSLVYQGVQSSIEQSRTTVETIEDIQLREGIPVVTRAIEIRDLLRTRSFTGTIKGIEQVDATAMILEKIETITVSLGDRVSRGDVLITLDKQNPSTRFRQAKDALDASVIDLNRSAELFSAGAISQQVHERAELAEKLARADFEAVERTLEVKAPIGGVVTDIFFERGETVSPGVPILRIAKLDRVYTEIEVGETDISLVKKGQQALVRTNSFPDRTFYGTVSKIALSTNPDARNFTISIEVPNPESLLKPGMFALLDLIVGKAEGVLAVPADAIISEDGNSYIYIVNSGMVVEKVPVSPGIVDGEWVEIQGEVSAGASVILEGHNKVVDGTKVTVIS